MLVDLCMYFCFKVIFWNDVGVADEIEVSDFEDCLNDYMELNFNVVLDDNSAKEVIIANKLMLIYR